MLNMIAMTIIFGKQTKNKIKYQIYDILGIIIHI